MDIITKFLETLPPVMAVLVFVIYMLFRFLATKEKAIERMASALETHGVALARLTTLIEMMVGRTGPHV